MRITPAPVRGCPSCCERSANRRPRPTTSRRGPLLTDTGRAEGGSYSSQPAAQSHRRDRTHMPRSRHEHQIRVEVIRPPA
jgi:hypothetical protein